MRNTTTVESVTEIQPSASDVQSLRGSALLLVGRFLSIGSNLVVQIVIVRALSKDDYGAFAYGLAVANLLTVVVGLGLDQTIQRFAAIYDEQRRFGRLAGALLVYLVTVAILGSVVATAAFALQGHLAGTLVPDRRTATLLGVFALLAPLQALDSLVMNLFAVYARPTAIFWRRYVLAPGMRILVVLVVVCLGASVEALASGYVLATGVGLAVYARVLYRLLHEKGVLSSGQDIEFPVAELLSFTVRAIAADLVVIVLFGSDVVIVGAFGSSSDVALLQAVQPVANGSLLIFYAMIPLFIPQATRFFATDNRLGLKRSYQRCTLWIVVFTCPVITLTVALAGPLTSAMFGERYRSAGAILALLAAGQYVLAVFGLTGLACKAVAQLRFLAAANIVVAALNIAVNVTLVPKLGPLGAAVGTAACLVTLSALKCIALRRATGVAGVDLTVLRGLATVAAGIIVLALWSALLQPPLTLALPAAVLVSLVILVVNRGKLQVGDVFPEVDRFWVSRWLFRPLRAAE